MAAAAPRLSTSLQRRIVTLFTQHLALKGTALLVTLVLWFVVKVKEPQVELVPVRFTPQLDTTLVMRDPMPENRKMLKRRNSIERPSLTPSSRE